MVKDGYDRIEYLRNIVNEGEEDKIVLKFVQKYREKIELETLDILKNTESDTAEAISDYRAVVRFCDMLTNIVKTGERKEEALAKELKKR